MLWQPEEHLGEGWGKSCDEPASHLRGGGGGGVEVEILLSVNLLASEGRRQVVTVIQPSYESSRVKQKYTERMQNLMAVVS